MKKIVVPCDFSLPAINAYQFALQLANKSGGEVHLLNVIELPVLHDTVLMPVVAFENSLFKELRASAEKQMQHLIARNKSEDANVICETRFGPVQTVIKAYVTEKSADLIVMGTHGAHGMREFLIGSNAEKMVRTASVPVITLKNAIKSEITDIVFPNTLDLENQEDLISKLKDIQEFFKAKLHIVWINTPLNFTSDRITVSRLEAFAKRFQFKNYTINVFNHENGEEGILLFANTVGANMIAMGTHGRRGLGHLFNGSIAEDLVNHANYLIWTSVMKEDIVTANS